MRVNNRQRTGRGQRLKVVVRAQLAAAIALGAVACAGNQAHEVQEAEVEAVEKSADQQVEAIDVRSDARNENIGQAAEARQQTIEENMDDPPAELAEERVELQKEQEIFVSDARARLNKLEVRVDEAERKLQLTKANTQRLKEEVQAARLQIDNLEQELQTLTTVEAAQWDQAKNQVEQRLSELRERVDMLQDEADG